MARKHRRPNPHAIAAREVRGDATTATAVRELDRPIDAERRQMEQGDRTKPSQPEGTAPIERQVWPINQDR